jgi:hypothetical protein
MPRADLRGRCSACREPNGWRHGDRQPPGPGADRPATVVKGVANRACLSIQQAPFLLQSGRDLTWLKIMEFGRLITLTCWFLARGEQICAISSGHRVARFPVFRPRVASLRTTRGDSTRTCSAEFHPARRDLPRRRQDHRSPTRRPGPGSRCSRRTSRPRLARSRSGSGLLRRRRRRSRRLCTHGRRWRGIPPCRRLRISAQTTSKPDNRHGALLR